jgi:hypothetical protein
MVFTSEEKSLGVLDFVLFLLTLARRPFTV